MGVSSLKYEIRTAEDFGAAIADRRKELGKTQAELSKTVGVSRDYLSKLESGRSSRVTEHVLRILRRTGATITVTFEDSPGD